MRSKNAIEIRHTRSYHDRFLIIDGATVWHVGDAGREMRDGRNNPGNTLA
jgi:hypothetical protein